MRNIGYHQITGIELDDVKAINGTAGTFYCRTLTITMEDGATDRLNLFSADGYKLLIADNDLDSLTDEPPLLKAA